MGPKRYFRSRILDFGLLFLIAGIWLSGCIPDRDVIHEEGATSGAAVEATSTPETILAPPAPTRTTEPSPTISPVELSHPILSVELLEPGSHSAFSYLTEDGEEVRYLLYLPENYSLDAQSPLIVYLHGNGSIGNNIDRLLNRTPLEYIESIEAFPFVVVSPQLPSGFWTTYIDPVDELVNHLGMALSVDGGRIYLTGISAGGYGVWKYALKYPDRFAAVSVISGTASLSANDPVPEDICTLKEVPLWVFHGDADTLILPVQSQAVVDALTACKSDVKFTLYSGARHNEAWINTYSDPAFYEWLLSNHQ